MDHLSPLWKQDEFLLSTEIRNGWKTAGPECVKNRSGKKGRKFKIKRDDIALEMFMSV